jgi:hypothetical protein
MPNIRSAAVFEYEPKGGEEMAVNSIPISAFLRITDMQDEVVQTFHRMRPDITRPQAEMVLDAVGIIRNAAAGNGFLIVTNELREA